MVNVFAFSHVPIELFVMVACWRAFRNFMRGVFRNIALLVAGYYVGVIQHGPM
jgi:hypothetical protein